MTKAELVAKMAEKAGLTKANAERALTEFLKAVQETLVTEKKMTLTGFGTFVVEERQARTGRNPRTGESVDVDAKRVPHFKPGKELRERLTWIERAARALRFPFDGRLIDRGAWQAPCDFAP